MRQAPTRATLEGELVISKTIQDSVTSSAFREIYNNQLDTQSLANGPDFKAVNVCILPINIIQ